MGAFPNTRSELLREPNLLVPGKKPVGPVKIDWSHPIANGLRVFLIFTPSQPYNLGPANVVQVAQPVFKIVNGKYGLRNTSYNYYPETLSEYTAAVGVEMPSPTWDGLIRLLGADNFTSFASRVGTNGLDLYVEGNRQFTAENTMPPGQEARQLISYSDANDKSSSYNKAALEYKREVDKANTRTETATSAYWNMIQSSSITQGSINYFIEWDRYLSQAESESVMYNPYQILIPA